MEWLLRQIDYFVSLPSGMRKMNEQVETHLRKQLEFKFRKLGGCFSNEIVST